MRDILVAGLPAWAAVLVPTYKFMLSLSLIAGCWWVVRRLRSQGWDEGKTLNALLLAVIGSLLGSKAVYLLQYGDFNLNAIAWVLEIYHGGYSLWGGFLGASLFAFVYLRWARLPLGPFGAACAPAMALGLVLTRLGCFLRGCNFGVVTDLPWGVRFPPGTDAFQNHVITQRISVDASSSLPVHPTQLYEVGLGVVLLALALGKAPRWRFQGRLELLMIYAVARFFLEFVRGDAGGVTFGPLTFAQGIAVAILAGSLATYVYFHRLRATNYS